MRAVNLLPSDQLRVRKPVNRVVLAGVASGAAVAMLSGALYMNAKADVKDQGATLAAVKAELASIPAPKAPPAHATELVAERSERVTALSTALSSRVMWDRVLRELSSVLPENVWLSHLNAKVPAASGSAEAVAQAATSAAPTGFRLDGYTYTHEGVALLLARLQVIPDLTNVQLVSSTGTVLGDEENGGGQHVVQFSIQANIAPPGGTS